VTAAASGFGSLSNVTANLVASNINLPTIGSGGPGAPVTAFNITGLTVGAAYMMNCQLSLGVPANTTGYSGGSFFRFQFSTGGGLVVPQVYPGDASGNTNLPLLPDIYTADLQAVSAGAPGVNVIYTTSYNCLILAKSTSLVLLCTNTSTTAGSQIVLAGGSGAAQSFIQLQQFQ
jgi:hypothetical protein